MQYKSKYTGAEIDSILDKASASNGIAIVENVSDLDPNAQLGSLAAVVEPGSIAESSFRDLYQPDASMIDQTTGTLVAPELLSGISSINVFAPESMPTEIEQINTGIYIVPRDFSQENSNIAMIMLRAGMIGAMVIMGGDFSNMQDFLFIEPNEDGTFTIHDDQVEAFNSILDNGMDWCYFALPESTEPIPEEVFDIWDLFITAVAGIPSKAHVYLKKDNWKELYAKDFEKLANNISKVEASVNSKADKMSMATISIFDVVEPNTYTAFEITGAYLSYTIKLAPIKDTTTCNEYVLELKCTGTPKEGVVFHNEDGTVVNIVWANGVAPSFEEGNSYLISIINGFGVYSIFPIL